MLSLDNSSITASQSLSVRKKSSVTQRKVSRSVSVKQKIEEDDRKKGVTKDKLIEEEMAAVGSVSFQNV